MQLRTLTLENYRKFENTTAEFPEGLVGILGMNGVGKSTIIEAIAWALYGNKETIVRTSKEDVKRIGAAPKDPCRVTLEFELEGENYRVVREMKGVNFTTNAEITINNKLAANSSREATNFIETRIGMDYQAFYTSVFAKQKELNALSGLAPHERKKLVLRMLNINAVDFAIRDIRKDRNVKKTVMETDRKHLFDENGNLRIEAFNNELESTVSEKKSILPAQKEIKTKLNELEMEFKALKKAVDSQETKREKFNNLNQELAKHSATEKVIESDIKNRLKDLKDLNTRAQKLVKMEPDEKEWLKVKARKSELERSKQEYRKKLDLESEVKKLQQDLQERHAKIEAQVAGLKKFAELETELKKIGENKIRTQTEFEACQNAKSTFSAKIDQKKGELQELLAKLSNIKELGPSSECPTCERPLEDHYDNLVEKFNRDIIKAQEAIGELRQEFDKKECELQALTKLREAQHKRERHLQDEQLELEGLKSALGANRNELKLHEMALTEKEKAHKKLEKLEFSEKEFREIEVSFTKLEKVHDEIIPLRAEVKAIPALKQRLEGLQVKLDQNRSRKTKLENELKTLAFDKEEYDGLKDKYELKNEQLTKTKLELNDLQNKLEKFEEKIKDLKNKIEELQKLETQIQATEEEIKYLNKLDQVMNNFKTHLISRISPMLSEFASELFRKLTDGKYNEMVIDEDYNIYIYDEGTKYELSRFSGGEEDLANLCLRLAISQIIAVRSAASGLNFIILDEIFGSQDLSRKRNLMLALNELSNKFRQIFLITHIEDIKEYIGNVINVVENEQGISSVKLIG